MWRGMGKRRAIIRNKKERGEWAELCFMAAAMEHGLPVAKPWGDSRSYDVVAGWPGHFLAVQVKSTVCELCGGYACTLRTQNRRYRPGAYDFLAGYVILEDAWYIIPEKLVRGKERVSLASDSERAHYEQYREAWHLLGDPREKIELEGCAEEECTEETVMQRTRSAVPTFARMLGVLAWRRAVDCLYAV